MINDDDGGGGGGGGGDDDDDGVNYGSNNNNNNNNNQLTAILNDILRSYVRNRYSERQNLENKKSEQNMTLHNEVHCVC
jgi:hypothetical protein